MEPQVFTCAFVPPSEAAERGEWVVKLMGKSRAELVGDWVGCLLASTLGLRTPEVSIVEVDADALSTCPAPVMAWATPGPAFASRYLSDTRELLGDRAVVDGCPGEFLGSLYALDTWLEVLDRKKPEGSWNLIKRNAEGDANAYVIDFGKCMAPCLFPPVLGPEEIRPPASYSASVRRAADLKSAVDTAASIGELPDASVRDVCASIPQAWLASDEQRTNIETFLLSRRQGVVATCRRLKEDLP
jgi:hypothetical protein